MVTLCDALSTFQQLLPRFSFYICIFWGVGGGGAREVKSFPSSTEISQFCDHKEGALS